MRAAHVLFVDDSTTVRMVITAELREAGFRVTPVPTLDGARRALSQAKHHAAFDLVILDLSLPDGDGIDLLREIRNDPDLSNMPVMILSGDARFGSRLQGLGVGADDFVGKPHSKAYLVGRARALTRTRVTDQESPRPWRVVIVDPDSGIRQTLARLLRVGHGCDVVALENVAQATEYFDVETTGADCVVVERRSSQRVLGIMHAKRSNAGLPVIVLDDAPSGVRPAASSRPHPRPNSSRFPLVMARNTDLANVAEAVVRRINEDQGGAPRVASGSIPPAHRSTPIRLVGEA